MIAPSLDTSEGLLKALTCRSIANNKFCSVHSCNQLSTSRFNSQDIVDTAQWIALFSCWLYYADVGRSVKHRILYKKKKWPYIEIYTWWKLV